MPSGLRTIMAASKQQPQGYDQAVKAFANNRTPRQAALCELREWVETTQYHGLPSWWDESGDRPLLERAPCISYPIVDAAIESNVDLVLGEGRFPEIRLQLDDLAPAKAKAITAVDDEDEGEDPDDDEGQEANVYAEDGLRKLLRLAKFRSSARMALREGQSAASVATIIGLRDGVPFLDHARADWCTPTFSGSRLIGLEIRYPYLDTGRSATGAQVTRCLIYRRVIDERRDVTYLPGIATESGAEPKWTEDPAQTFEHGLGFCPVVWYAHMRECDAVNRIDGHAIHERCLDEIHALNIALSLRHKAAVMLGAPTVWETGVEPGEGPGASGRPFDPSRDPTAIPSTLDGGKPSHSNPVNGWWAGSRSKTARKTGPGALWSYTSPDVKVGLLELGGDALKALDDHARDLRIKVAESLCVVFLDPENVKFASTTSGKALMQLKARQLDRCDQYRDDFWAGWIEPALRMLLRVVTRPDVELVGLPKSLVPTLATVAGAQFEPEWGPYFPDTAEDKKATLDVVKAARDLKLLSRRRALEIVGRLVGVTDFDAEEDAIEAEDEESREQAREDADRHSRALHAAMKLGADGDDNDDGADDDGAPIDPGAGEGPGQGAPTDAAPGGRASRRAAARLAKRKVPR